MSTKRNRTQVNTKTSAAQARALIRVARARGITRSELCRQAFEQVTGVHAEVKEAMYLPPRGFSGGLGDYNAERKAGREAREREAGR